jgi:hypothetical protein
MTALEMQFAALTLAREAFAARQTPDIIDRMCDYNATILLPSAVPFSWSADTTSAVWSASATVPMDAVLERDVIPEDSNACWWWFDWPLPIPVKNVKPSAAENDATRLIAGIMLARYEDRLLIVDARMTPHGPAMVGFFVVSFEQSLNSIINTKARVFHTGTDAATVEDPTTRKIKICQFILAANAWLRQRILVSSDGPIERHRRKQIARDHNVLPPTDVKVIELRRVESHPHAGPGDPVDWSCRWVVGGHWRNQPYKDGTRLRYILPYVKGPADKPLRIPAHTVYRVDR